MSVNSPEQRKFSTFQKMCVRQAIRSGNCSFVMSEGTQSCLQHLQSGLRSSFCMRTSCSHESDSAKVRRSGSRGVAELHLFYNHLNTKVFLFFSGFFPFLGSEDTCRNTTVKQTLVQTRRRSSSSGVREQRAHSMLLLPSSANTPSCATAQRIQPGVDHKLITNDGVIKERFADL